MDEKVISVTELMIGDVIYNVQLHYVVITSLPVYHMVPGRWFCSVTHVGGAYDGDVVNNYYLTSSTGGFTGSFRYHSRGCRKVQSRGDSKLKHYFI